MSCRSPPALWLVYEAPSQTRSTGPHDQPDDEAEAVIEPAQVDLLLGERVLVAARRAAAQRVRLRHRRRAARGRQVARVAVVEPRLVDQEGRADGDVPLDLPRAGERLLERGEGLRLLVEAQRPRRRIRGELAERRVDGEADVERLGRQVPGDADEAVERRRIGRLRARAVALDAAEAEARAGVGEVVDAAQVAHRRRVVDHGGDVRIGRPGDGVRHRPRRHQRIGERARRTQKEERRCQRAHGRRAYPGMP